MKYVVEDIKVDKKISDLATIILKIEQSIEPKFLRRPLGNNFTYLLKNYFISMCCKNNIGTKNILSTLIIKVILTYLLLN